MRWIAPIERAAATSLEKHLGGAADQFRANSGPILGWIFLRFAEARFMLRRDDHE